MSEVENWMDSFRTQERKNVYVLTVTMITVTMTTVTMTEEEKKVQAVKEVVDCPEGEMGAWYAHNLLFRLANETLKGTEFERVLWKERWAVTRASDKDYAYIKTIGGRKRVIAEMKWYQQLPEE